ncbi:MAG: hypothetical protein ACI9BK_000662 [Acidimicrobiales bacterium]
MDERTQKDFRLAIAAGRFRSIPVASGQFDKDLPELTTLTDHHTDQFTQLMLDAYRGSVDDEGETFDVAGEATDLVPRKCLRPRSRY